MSAALSVNKLHCCLELSANIDSEVELGEEYVENDVSQLRAINSHGAT
jgi:hypothetical protein